MCDNESWNREKMLNNLSDFFSFIEDTSCTEKQVAWIAQVWFWFILPWCLLWHPKSSILVSFDPTIFSHYCTGLSKCCTFRATFRQDILNIFHHAFLHQWWKANIILCDDAYNCGGWVHYLFSQKQLYLPIPGLSVALHKRCLALKTTLLIILLTPLPKILWGASGYVKLCSFHFPVLKFFCNQHVLQQ